MLDSLKWLGEQLAESGTDQFLREKVKSLRKTENEAYLVRVIFNADENKIIAEPIHLDEKTLEEYLWVGNTATAAREPVARLTTDNLEYLIEQKNNLIRNISNAIKKWMALDKSKALEELNSYLSIIEEHFLRRQNVFDEIKGCVNMLGKEFEGKVYLYTVCLKYNGRLIELAKTEGYKRFLINVLISPKPEKLREGICHVCGKIGQVLPNPSFESGSIPKIYVTDKKGFTSGLLDSDDARMKNFAICIECRQHITWAWYYIKKRLRAQNIGGIDAYIIPRLTLPIQIINIDSLSEYMKKAYGVLASFDELARFDHRLKEDAEKLTGIQWYSLTVVFGASEQSKFRIETVIQDVPVTRLSLLNQKMRDFERLALSLFGGDMKTWSLRFSDIYSIFPVPVERDKPRLREFLELVDSMLSASSYALENLIYHAVQFARIQRFGSGGYNIKLSKNRDLKMCVSFIKYNLLINMLEEINVLKREEVGVIPQEYLPTKIKNWFEEVKYNELQQALFILGYLVGDIGTAQYNKGDKKKSILDKVDFYGMSAEKIMRLSTEILDSLRNYRKLNSENEILYYYMKKLLDKNVHELRKNPLSNVFYLLSGYAFKTYMNIKGSENA